MLPSDWHRNPGMAMRTVRRACFEHESMTAFIDVCPPQNSEGLFDVDSAAYAVAKLYTSHDSLEGVQFRDQREIVRGITNIRERALTVTQLKLGCRSSELANIDISDISIKHDELREHYTEMGTHPKIEQYENAVFIPSGRDGNKREVDTILPLDEETRQAIVDWLLIRPDNGKDAVFFTAKGKRPSHNDIAHFWKQYWWPEYKHDVGDYYDSVTPHWCRHHFTTWWSNQGITRLQRKYMRGDRTDEYNRRRSAMDNYMHEYYENIEPVYREGIFQLRLDKV